MNKAKRPVRLRMRNRSDRRMARYSEKESAYATIQTRLSNADATRGPVRIMSVTAENPGSYSPVV